MRQRSAARSRGQDGCLQPRRLVAAVRQGLVRAQYGGGLEQHTAGSRQLATQVEEFVPDDHQVPAHVGRQRLGQQHSQAGVGLIDVAHRRHAQVALGQAAAVTQDGAAVISSPGGNLRQAAGYGGFGGGGGNGGVAIGSLPPRARPCGPAGRCHRQAC